jgi:3',5'-cyclic AMP phosphodiesterase CpdA
LGAGVVSLSSRAQSKSIRWALLSDTHIAADRANEYRGFRPYDNLRRVVGEVGEWKPDTLFFNGDLARLEGLPGDYQLFQKTIEPLSGIPAGLTLGNHDDRKNFFAAFGTPASGQPQPVQEKHVLVIEQNGLRVVLLDSLYLVNQAAGLLGKDQRAWLDAYLRTSNLATTIIFVHHTLDDGDGSLLDAERFLRIVSKYRTVKAVFYGHSHRYAYDTMEGMHLVNLPAVGYNFLDGEPVGWVQANVSGEGVELTLRVIGGNREGHDKTRSLAWRA